MPLNRSLMKMVSMTHRFWYELTGGLIGGSFLGAQNVLLTTTGRKSGRKRTNPLVAVPEGDGYVVIASNGGSDRHPDWFLNLRAAPDAELQVGSRRLTVRAQVATDEEKARLWPRIVETFRGYDQYQRETKRNIPVVFLRPANE